MDSSRRFSRPVRRADLDGFDSTPDAAARSALAHELAHQLIPAARNHAAPARNAESTKRFVNLAEEFGIETIADLWSQAPAISLPGALWRLYALRGWIAGQPQQAASWYRDGRSQSAAEVVAGVADPPGPAEVAQAADEILAGAFEGDFAGALERASAFVTVTARGRASEETDHRSLQSFVQMADDLRTAAREFRTGRLF